MADINLLQNQLRDTTLIAIRRTKIVVWLAFIVLLLFIGSGVGLYFMTGKVNSQVADLSATNLKLQDQLQNQQQGLSQAQAYQAQLTNLKTLLQNHIAFSPLINELAKYTYQKASYTIFDVAQDTGKIHVEGVVDSYIGLGKLLLGLSTSHNFSGVKLLAVNQTSGDVNGFNFSIDLKASADAFKKLSQ